MKWFVYDNEQYYPSAMIVEADTAEDALRKLADDCYLVKSGAVFSLDALAVDLGGCIANIEAAGW